MKNGTQFQNTNNMIPCNTKVNNLGSQDISWHSNWYLQFQTKLNYIHYTLFLKARSYILHFGHLSMQIGWNNKVQEQNKLPFSRGSSYPNESVDLIHSFTVAKYCQRLYCKVLNKWSLIGHQVCKFSMTLYSAWWNFPESTGVFPCPNQIVLMSF